MTALRHNYRSVTKIFFILLIEAWFLQQPVFGMTAILVKRTGSFVIVAADSRAISTEGKPRADQTCKIQLLDRYSFFAGAGVTSNKSGTPGEFPFAAKQEALHAYRPNASMEDIANAWANSMEAIYSEQPLAWKREILSVLNQIHRLIIDRLIRYSPDSGSLVAMVAPSGVLGNGKSRTASAAGGRNRQLTAPRRRDALLCVHPGAPPLS